MKLGINKHEYIDRKLQFRIGNNYNIVTQLSRNVEQVSMVTALTWK